MLALDCNTFFGVRPEERTDHGAPTLVEQLAAHGVAGALTLSLRGVLYDHRLGNEETLRVCAAYPGLIPAATVRRSFTAAMITTCTPRRRCYRYRPRRMVVDMVSVTTRRITMWIIVGAAVIAAIIVAILFTSGGGGGTGGGGY